MMPHRDAVCRDCLADALDDVMAEDASWFATNPEAGARVRPLSRAEAAELGVTADRASSWSVAVYEIAPGVRLRSITTVRGAHE